MTVKWNPQTARYEKAPMGVDSQDKTIPNYPAFHGDVYIDANTGVVKYRNAGGVPDTPLDYNEKTGKYEITVGGRRVAYNLPAGSQFYKGSAPIGANNPKTAGTGKPTDTTVKPDGKNMKPPTTAQQNAVTPTTMPKTGVTPTTTPKAGVTPTTNPKGGVSPTSTVPVNSVSPTSTVPVTSTTINPVVTGYVEQIVPTASKEEKAALAAYFSAALNGGGGGGTNRAQERADKLADEKRAAASRRKGAAIQTAAGQKAQQQYNALAEKAFTDAQTASQAFYKTQADQANTTIDKATTDYLSSLVAPTAYSNVPIAELVPQLQGLTQNLQAYGATGQQAQQQQTQDAGFNQFISQLLSRGTQQMQQADQGYFDAMRNAGTGGQAAARLGVAQNTAAMQNQSTAQAEAIRRQLMQAGIDALIAGQTNAANTLAQ
jgi:hypothetical protein